jgi:hypothetical protein
LALSGDGFGGEGDAAGGGVDPFVVADSQSEGFEESAQERLGQVFEVGVADGQCVDEVGA